MTITQEKSVKGLRDHHTVHSYAGINIFNVILAQIVVTPHDLIFKSFNSLSLTADADIVNIIVITRRPVVSPWSTVFENRHFGPAISGHVQCRKMFGKVSAYTPQY